MLIRYSCAIMLHLSRLAFMPQLATQDMVLPTATLSYVFGLSTWAVSFTLSYSPFGYAAPVVKLQTVQALWWTRHPY